MVYYITPLTINIHSQPMKTRDLNLFWNLFWKRYQLFMAHAFLETQKSVKRR